MIEIKGQFEVIFSQEMTEKKKEEIITLVNGLACTRRMKRDLSKIADKKGLVLGKPWQEYGDEGEFYFNPESTNFGQEKDPSVIDDYPPSTQPSFWLQWNIKQFEDKWYVVWDGVEKFYDPNAWLEYLVTKIFKPNNVKIFGYAYIFDDCTNETRLLIANKAHKIYQRSRFKTSPFRATF
jgi:hypothetical protein